MITFIQFLITGLRLGSVYALIALGYTMVYGIIKLINFAHGDFIMVGGYSLFFTIPVLMAAGIPGWLAVVPAIIICACVGMLVELLAYRPVRKTGNNLTCLITAIAMSFVLENLAQAIPAIGPDPKVHYTLRQDLHHRRRVRQPCHHYHRGGVCRYHGGPVPVYPEGQGGLRHAVRGRG